MWQRWQNAFRFEGGRIVIERLSSLVASIGLSERDHQFVDIGDHLVAGCSRAGALAREANRRLGERPGTDLDKLPGLDGLLRRDGEFQPHLPAAASPLG
jgi:hypothetical protein